MRATIVDTGCSAIAMVDQRVCGSVCSGVEMTEEDSTAVKGAGSALLGMGTSTDWTKKDVRVYSNVLGDAGDVAGCFDSRNHEVTCPKRVFASGVVAMREGGLKVVRVSVLLVLGGKGASLGPVGGVGWFIVVVVVREERKR